MGERYQLTRCRGRWHVLTRDTANAVWFSLGGCTDLATATRIWLALLSEQDRK